jgi:hypothetical protein
MTTAEHEATRDLAALQQLPGQEPRVDDDPTCATTGVAQHPHTDADSAPDSDVTPDADDEPDAS